MAFPTNSYDYYDSRQSTWSSNSSTASDITSSPKKKNPFKTRIFRTISLALSSKDRIPNPMSSQSAPASSGATPVGTPDISRRGFISDSTKTESPKTLKLSNLLKGRFGSDAPKPVDSPKTTKLHNLLGILSKSGKQESSVKIQTLNPQQFKLSNPLSIAESLVDWLDTNFDSLPNPEGIFRESGNESTVMDLYQGKKSLDTETNVHDVASTLKKIFHQNQECKLFKGEAKKAFLKIVEIENEDQIKDDLTKVMNLLSDPEKEFLLKLLSLLEKIIAKKETKMTQHSLSLTIGQCLVQQATDNIEFLSEVTQVPSAVEKLIEHSAILKANFTKKL
jgi:hypothetical protein